MSVDLGDLVSLSVQIRNASGVLENATSVTLTITLPDSTTATFGPLPSTSPGVYDYDYPTVQAGRHGVRWVATGANASAYTDVFDVVPADGGAFISLADAKNHLRKQTGVTVDDEVLRWFVATACQVIKDRMGHVSPVTVVADRRAHRGVVVLPERPVISVTSVQRLPGLAAVLQADPGAGTDGWTLESSEGVMSVGWCDRVRVTYRAGRSPVPPNFRLAALELVAHLWRGSQHNSGGGRPALGESDSTAWAATSFALPYRVMELLGLRKNQERDEPLVG